MTSTFHAQGRKVMQQFSTGEVETLQVCEDEIVAQKVAELVRKAYAANNARKYTQSARLYRQAYDLCGIETFTGEEG